MPEKEPTRRIGPQGLLKRRRPESDEAAAAGETRSPSGQPGPAPARPLRLPASTLPDVLLPLPSGFDLTPEAAARVAGQAPVPKRRAG